ncbi:MAG: ribose 5-phosphate isomerase B [Clostridiales bacterium]|jgi:ribose 5-phosphate isomerase B|nr:ribose 5-phosphate isomerase B [Clostridiales bacterium]
MIAIGSDHAGFRLKELIIRHLEERALPCRDFGAFDGRGADYVPIGAAVAEAVAAGACERGILICGTGIGMSIAANKRAGIRAALCGDTYSAELSRRHNDANVLALGARVVGEGLAMRIVDAWLDAPFDGGRHLERVKLISRLEESVLGGLGGGAAADCQRPQKCS